MLLLVVLLLEEMSTQIDSRETAVTRAPGSNLPTDSTEQLGKCFPLQIRLEVKYALTKQVKTAAWILFIER